MCAIVSLIAGLAVSSVFSGSGLVCAYQLSLRRPRGVARLLGQRHRVRSLRRPRGVARLIGQRHRDVPAIGFLIAIASPGSISDSVLYSLRHFRLEGTT